ncbi:AMP-binding protein [Amycolatopsis sp. NPDC051903]|uniref:AMP-binding protein n=1 Tax=Amycolatopsis sp. NPDC051903 TaxID=3363936 RepID=UPI00379D66C9
MRSCTTGATGWPVRWRRWPRGGRSRCWRRTRTCCWRRTSVWHLWTLPMFHCNGCCFPWAVTAAAATHVCLPKVDPAEVWRLIREEGMTHLNGARRPCCRCSRTHRKPRPSRRRCVSRPAERRRKASGT